MEVPNLIYGWQIVLLSLVLVIFVSIIIVLIIGRIKMFNKFRVKLNRFLYHYHLKKSEKYFRKVVKVIKYDPKENMELKCKASALYGMSVYADTDSVASPDINSSYPSNLYNKF